MSIVEIHGVTRRPPSGAFTVGSARINQIRTRNGMAAQANKCEFKGRTCELDRNSKKTAGCFSGLVRWFLALFRPRLRHQYSVHDARQKIESTPVTLISISPLDEPDYDSEPDPRTRMLESAVATARQALDKGTLRFPRKEWRSLTSAYYQHHKEKDTEKKEFFDSKFKLLKNFVNNDPSPKSAELRALLETENTDTAFWVMQKFINVIARDDKSHALPMTDNQIAFNDLVASELGTMMNVSTAIQDGYSGLINDYMNPTRASLNGSLGRLVHVLSAIATMERQSFNRNNGRDAPTGVIKKNA